MTAQTLTMSLTLRAVAAPHPVCMLLVVEVLVRVLLNAAKDEIAVGIESGPATAFPVIPEDKGMRKSATNIVQHSGLDKAFLCELFFDESH